MGSGLSRPAPAPGLVEMTPPNGATDVDPDLAELVFVFDQPMKTGQWSIVGGGDSFPVITGTIHYDASGKVLHVPVRLSPDHVYHFRLNNDRFTGFQNRAGTPLPPVAIRFETGPP
jgi:hypothetical protein